MQTRSYTGRLADPDFRHRRAVAAARARTALESHVRAVVARAPELTPEQIEDLARLLNGGRPARGAHS